MRNLFIHKKERVHLFRLEYDEEVRPHTPGRLATLRIKSETGDTVRTLYCNPLIHLSTDLCPQDAFNGYHWRHPQATQQIKVIRQSQTLPILLWYRSNGDKKDLVLKGAFPPRSFNDMTATLSDCGLVPSANLFLANKSNNLRR